MAGFIYAIEKARTVSKKVLEDVGLATVLGDIETAQRHTAAGPGGGECVLLMGPGADTKLLYYRPEQQTWQKSLNGRYWVGFYNEDPPSEAVLQRNRQLAGHKVKLVDGSEWLVPVARILSGGSALPRALILGTNGEVVTEVLPQYCEFSSRVEKLWQDFQIEQGWQQGRPAMDLKQRWHLAAEALSWNYHVGIVEVNLLKLISSQTLGDILGAVIDLPTLETVAKEIDAHKKKDNPAGINDGLTTGDGAGES